MKWLQPQNKKQEEKVNDHDQPTEPIERLVLPTYRPSSLQVENFPLEQTIPNSPPTMAQQVPAVPPAPFSYSPPQPTQAYSVLPPLPAQQKPQPSSKKANVGVQVGGMQRRKGAPMTVGLLFVGVQMLLLVRFVMNFFVLSADNMWRDIVYTLSDVFLLPFHLLFLHIVLPTGVATQLYILLAVLVYGLLSRIVVRLLKRFSYKNAGA